ncbi:PTS sugar transporter subunit IIA [Stomatohabitans albus]|uniref:PTS sugar transporter subunit IIA n=1 Tax=Stomatohabitans albus TaxID=3110766 RepID=UPI00300C901A
MNEFYAVWETDATTSDALFHDVVPRLVAEGVAQPSLTEALIAREQAFPTGLDFGHVQVALPHADPEHIARPGVILVRHHTPITFLAMGEPETVLEAQASLWPIVVDAQAQLELLGKMIALLQDEPSATTLIEGDQTRALTMLSALTT